MKQIQRLLDEHRKSIEAVIESVTASSVEMPGEAPKDVKAAELERLKAAAKRVQAAKENTNADFDRQLGEIDVRLRKVEALIEAEKKPADGSASQKAPQTKRKTTKVKTGTSKPVANVASAAPGSGKNRAKKPNSK